jgi:signal recognition particle receptor subunit beta
MICKVVYCGPEHSGKTTNLRHIRSKISDSRLLSVQDNDGSTVFTDLLPLRLGTVDGFLVTLHLFAVSGQPAYENVRRVALRGADGIVFVADSSLGRVEDNLASLGDLAAHLGSDLRRLPMVIQYNKRDIPDRVPVEDIRALLNICSVPDFEAVATDGRGVIPTLKEIARQVVRRARRGRGNCRVQNPEEVISL